MLKMPAKLNARIALPQELLQCIPNYISDLMNMNISANVHFMIISAIAERVNQCVIFCPLTTFLFPENDQVKTDAEFSRPRIYNGSSQWHLCQDSARSR